jgi:hypothetical protein
VPHNHSIAVTNNLYMYRLKDRSEVNTYFFILYEICVLIFQYNAYCFACTALRLYKVYCVLMLTSGLACTKSHGGGGEFYRNSLKFRFLLVIEIWGWHCIRIHAFWFWRFADQRNLSLPCLCTVSPASHCGRYVQNGTYISYRDPFLQYTQILVFWTFH